MGSSSRSWYKLPDQIAYALFADHADGRAHDQHRRTYRGTDFAVAFDVYLARVYALAWASSLAAGVTTGIMLITAPASLFAIIISQGTSVITQLGLITVLNSLITMTGAYTTTSVYQIHVQFVVAVILSLSAVGTVRWSVIYMGGRYLRWVTTARRAAIDRTLPSAVRYLNVLSSGSDNRRAMLRRVADTDAYGETATSIRTVLNTAAMTGNINEGLRRVARDTPAQETLGPFLLKFREHADQGEDALGNYLSMESRMLRYRQDSERQRAQGFLELLAELFVVLLVLPALVVIIITVMSLLSPGLAAPIQTIVGVVTIQEVIVYGSAVFILAVGIGAASLVESLRPADQKQQYVHPPSLIGTLTTATQNPSSAMIVFTLIGVVGAGLSVGLDVDLLVASLVGYVSYSIPVGVVAVRRARSDDAKDHELKDFVHAISGHINLGRPFVDAVTHVASDVDLGPLSNDVTDLASNLQLTTAHGGVETDLRTAALDRFVTRVGTPLAEQTVGLVIGAMDAGSDTGVVFETLQAEVGRLYHEKRSLRSGMLVYVAVGWTTALLVIGITVATSTQVFAGFARLAITSDVAGVAGGEAIDLVRDQYRLYIVTQSTMLAAGWFAGVASRGRYEALLHSGCLVAICHLVFVGTGVI
ncbi:type II secretion system F family protein [Haloquadratum walsbyi]|jgi:archaellum biogenesis protein FlaJ (TadC family)|uniref:Type IV pilus biogenesis complex membrane subunit n=1 Tax=Haloquadratum walsbyi (strain DSM 16790 / HBSQ001) TaxID=362976 RepID=Q18KJ1_HALWD|nr:type II secretion system F family protein [Haloquadratum walsbyi]CAJ51457.1 type IV pilus biogenesis complex membrane subunit [Haloquadratum walsbyi DSM 16790]